MTEQTPNQQAQLADVPDATVEPPSSLPSQIPRPRTGTSVQQLLTLATRTAEQSGIALLSSAARLLYRDTSLEEHMDCANFYGAPTTCVPTSSYFGNPVTNCNGTGKALWHRKGEEIHDGKKYEFTINYTACAGKNAWRWNKSNNNQGDNVKCSDGAVRIAGGPSHWSICRSPVDWP